MYLYNSSIVTSKSNFRFTLRFDLYLNNTRSNIKLSTLRDIGNERTNKFFNSNKLNFGEQCLCFFSVVKKKFYTNENTNPKNRCKMSKYDIVYDNNRIVDTFNYLN